MRQESVVHLRILAILALAVGFCLPLPGMSQTSPEQCVLDSLVLLSPEENGLSIRLAGPGERFGAFIHWQEPADEDATCVAIRNPELLPIEVDLTGTYLDDVDRELEFFTLQSGEVGSPTQNRLLVSWFNVFVSRSGSVEGQINLSNNGGVLRYNRANGAWSRFNAGLPQYLPFTDIIASAQSAQDPDHYLLHLGSQGLSEPAGRTLGLWERRVDSSWSRLATDEFPDGVVITKLAYSPDSDMAFAVGTKLDGLYLTRDSGASFQRFTTELAPEHPAPPANFEVTAITWEPGGTLYVAVRAFGLFVSDNDGATWTWLDDLLVPQNLQDPFSLQVFPFVNQILIDRDDPDHILVAITNHALYHSTDGGQTWGSLTGNWIDPLDEGWRHTGVAVDLDPQDNQVILVGTKQKGIWRTADGGATWLRVGENVYPQAESVDKPVRNLFFDPTVVDGVFVMVDKLGLLSSSDAGQNWVLDSNQPSNITATEMHLNTRGNGDLVLASYAGGIYTPGTRVPISATITSSAHQDLDLGLYISFGAGSVDANFTFRIVCQDFQGYAVWRSDTNDPTNLELIGFYDKTNPETCIEGFCGDMNFNIIPNCFSAKRAACFDFDPPGGGIEFFDDSVYNGFLYFYAVTTFDYLNTAGVEPTALSRDMLFSPRFPSALTDSLTNAPPGSEPLEPKDRPVSSFPFWGRGNLLPYQVNVAAQPAADGTEIYVFPNPLRSDVGFPGKEGNQVVFTNLPPESRVQVFTEDGDIVADLGSEQQDGSNIYWVTVNDSNEILVSGIYLWRVQMPERGDFWGKLVIIR